MLNHRSQCTGQLGKRIESAGLPTTDSLHVVERFHRIDRGHLEIEQTIDDPNAYTNPEIHHPADTL